MKFAVRYYSQTGNTKRLAEAIAGELGVTPKSVEQPLEEKTDVVILCNSVYWAGVDAHVKSFLKENKNKIGCLVNASTAAFIESTYSQMKKITEADGILLSDKEFHCRGQFTAMHKGHPNTDDLMKATAFAKLLKEN